MAIGTLAAYVVLDGIDSPLLKWLQNQGSNHLATHGGGLNPISFSNVYFVSFFLVGIILLIADYRRLPSDWKSLDGSASRAIAGGAFCGMFLGPLSYFISLKYLSVIGQSLIFFSALLPISALLALVFLKEGLPRRFGLSLALITCGLVLSSGSMGGMADGGGNELLGIALVLISVLAYAMYDIAYRSLEGLDLGQGITLGVGSMVSALVFAVIELWRLGPHYLLQLDVWWALGLIAIYGILIRLLGGMAELGSLGAWPVATVELWANLSVVVSVVSGAVFLGEPLALPTIIGVGIVMAGVMLPCLNAAATVAADL